MRVRSHLIYFIKSVVNEFLYSYNVYVTKRYEDRINANVKKHNIVPVDLANTNVRKRWSEEEIERVNLLKEQGHTLEQISLKVGRSVDSIKPKLYKTWDKHYAKHEEKVKKRGRKWHQKNHERSLENKREWYKSTQ